MNIKRMVKMLGNDKTSDFDFQKSFIELEILAVGEKKKHRPEHCANMCN